MDHTDEWEKCLTRKSLPNDPPLTEQGHEHASEVGEILSNTEKPFVIIISSPYYRCAQTASRLAQSLDVPVHFDMDLGEICDNISQVGDIAGKIQHRPPEELKAQLQAEFPGVNYVCDENDQLKIEGHLPVFPEHFAGAQMRFCYKVKKLLQRAAAECVSIVVVTHGDALSAVIGLMRETWSIGLAPYTAHAICSRKVKVMDVGGEILKEEPVYDDCDSWTEVKMSEGFVYKEIKKGFRREAHRKHGEKLEEIEEAMVKMPTKIDADYDVDPEHEEHMHHAKSALQRMKATDTEVAIMMRRGSNSEQMGPASPTSDKKIRISGFCGDCGFCALCNFKNCA